ncbi:hypothetical protein [Enterovibrio sp. 27052020O]|uniref:hypothetical protein n=1 Tax=Enterovibrio sp. 27052020O TaxID=3241166 RepID=UPI00388F3C3A
MEYGEALTPLGETVTLLVEPYKGCKDLGELRESLTYADVSEQYLTNYMRHIAARDLNANAIVVEHQEVITSYDSTGKWVHLVMYAGAYRCE